MALAVRYNSSAREVVLSRRENGEPGDEGSVSCTRGALAASSAPPSSASMALPR